MTTPNYTLEIEVPYGYCHCGCGQKTKTIKVNSTTRGLVKGQPYRYIVGHRHNKSTAKNLLEYRFWSKVVITANDDLCWEWQGGLSRDGYGKFNFQKRTHRSHRIAWLFPNYVIPKGMYILHSCDNPKCCNPKHLFLGTHQDNVDDMIRKGRNNIHGLLSQKTVI